MDKVVLVCCQKTCSKQGAFLILETFQKQVSTDIKVIRSSCLGECGNGPMVKVLPDNIWYSHVQPVDIAAIVDQHLIHNRPVKHKLHRKFHPDRPEAIAISIPWLLLLTFLGFIGGLWWCLANQTRML
ncbi:ferredoxin PetF2 [[Synechococcus] sp. NIES-970]|nr:ferredoxin PetF2 [[Synechococcus] sp. NIES-970]